MSATSGAKLIRACQEVHNSLIRLRGCHSALVGLPEEAFVLLALNEYARRESEGRGELATLAEHCKIILQAAIKSGILEVDGEGRIDYTAILPVIPIMAKLLRDANLSSNNKKTPGRKRQPTRQVRTPEGVEMDQESAVLQVLKTDMSARDVAEEFRRRGWSMGVKRMDTLILATLRASDLFQATGNKPERFDLSPKGEKRGLKADADLAANWGINSLLEEQVKDPLTGGDLGESTDNDDLDDLDDPDGPDDLDDLFDN